ncbi:hypothetical protein [Zavarzinia compransoris]|uniref:hypothetical protein n=1 Tax=Zavarzinia compransoris TaxID=1264899 RepID=UPI0010603F39|nr:hypothetical protein [Zavarzinia compransoris]
MEYPIAFEDGIFFDSADQAVKILGGMGRLKTGGRPREDAGATTIGKRHGNEEIETMTVQQARSG